MNKLWHDKYFNFRDYLELSQDDYRKKIKSLLLKHTSNFARQQSKESQATFFGCIKQLNNIARNNNWTYTLFPDSCPYSMDFAFYNKDGDFMFHGGLILHGLCETFSVQLETKPFINWSLHT